jgi:hypothetical protein
MFKRMTFHKWLKKYDEEYDAEAKRWQEKSGYKNLIPNDFDKTLLQQYTAYRTEMVTKNLVYATWVLAIATIVLSILTLVLK